MFRPAIRRALAGGLSVCAALAVSGGSTTAAVRHCHYQVYFKSVQARVQSTRLPSGHIVVRGRARAQLPGTTVFGSGDGRSARAAAGTLALRCFVELSRTGRVGPGCRNRYERADRRAEFVQLYFSNLDITARRAFCRALSAAGRSGRVGDLEIYVRRMDRSNRDCGRRYLVLRRSVSATCGAGGQAPQDGADRRIRTTPFRDIAAPHLERDLARQCRLRRQSGRIQVIAWEVEPHSGRIRVRYTCL